MKINCPTEEFFDHPYYRINKIYTKLVGVWPYQAFCTRRIILTILTLSIISIITPEAIKLRQNITARATNKIFDSIGPMIVIFLTQVKICNSSFNINKMKKLLIRIHNDWKNIKNESELEILRRYAHQGRKLTIYYSVYIYVSMTMYMITPLYSKIFDVIFPLNESRPVKFLYETDYGVDPEKYFYPILLHYFIETVQVITYLVVVDTMYMVYSQHACALFVITGYKVQQSIAVNFKNITQNKDDTLIMGNVGGFEKKRNLQLENKAYQECLSAVKMHQNAIQFAELLGSSYTVSLFLQVGASLILMSVSGVQMVLNLNHKDNVIRFGSFTIAQMLHLFFNSIPGQRVMDHSSKVFDDTYNAEWYLASPRIKKLTRMVLLRSFYPCILTAGKLYAMSMINFSSVIQTSFSYFTVLCSLQ